MAEIIAQLPTVVESLSGMKLNEIIGRVPRLANGRDEELELVNEETDSNVE